MWDEKDSLQSKEDCCEGRQPHPHERHAHPHRDRGAFFIVVVLAAQRNENVAVLPHAGQRGQNPEQHERRPKELGLKQRNVALAVLKIDSRPAQAFEAKAEADHGQACANPRQERAVGRFAVPLASQFVGQ